MTKEISNRIVVTHSDLITRAKYKLTALEMKFIALAVAQIDSVNDTEFVKYNIKVSDLKKIIDAKQNETRLKNFAKKLMSKPFEIPSMRTGGGWIMINWFSSIEYINNEARFECSVDPKLKPFLLELKDYFTKYDLSQYVQMNSIYAMRLFQYFNTLEASNKGYIEFNVADLQERLQVPKSLLRYDNFKRQAIEIALREINEKTNLHIEYVEFKKIRKKVISLRFDVRNKTEQFCRNKLLSFIERTKKKYTANTIFFKDDTGAFYFDKDNFLNHINKSFERIIFAEDDLKKIYIYLLPNEHNFLQTETLFA